MNTDGEVFNTYSYDEFGVEQDIDPNDTNPFRYCGELYDKNTDMLYLRARFYDADIGRFIQRDSYEGAESEALTLNRYTYCHNDPMNGWDPSGNKKTTEKQKNVVFGAIFISSHSVFWTPANHTSITIFVTKSNKKYYKSNKMKNYTKNSDFKYKINNDLEKFATIAATAKKGKLVSVVNRAEDIKTIKNEVIYLQTCRDNKIIDRFFEREKYYRIKNKNKPKYTLLPGDDPQKHNSNSFAHGLINSVGIEIPQEPTYSVPGWGNPVPNSHFGV